MEKQPHESTICGEYEVCWSGADMGENERFSNNSSKMRNEAKDPIKKKNY